MNDTFRSLAALTGAALSLPLLIAGPSHAAPGVDGKKATQSSASSDMVFDCLLSPFESAFRYETSVKMTSPNATDTSVELAATLTEIPGIAPVEIVDGRMHVELKGTVSDSPFTLTGDSVVNAAPKGKVAVPEMKGEVALTGEVSELVVESFSFKFNEMMGLNISASCQASRGGDLGTLSASGDAEAPQQAVGDAALASEDDEEGSVGSLLLWGVPVGVALAIAAFILSTRVRRRA